MIMISKAATLLIFGATIVSGQFMPRLLRPTPYDLSVMPDLRSNGCPPAPELAPVICQFMQPNMGLHYKPPLIAPSTYIPPLIVEQCDTPHIEIELPAKKPIVIPEAPILPPITIPKFPVPVIVEKPLPPPMPVVEPCEPAVITDGSAIGIPAAPALPPLDMPALPSVFEQHGAFMSGSVFEQHGGFMSGAVVNDIDFGYQSMAGPHPPELPAFVMPEPPVGVEPPMPLAPCPEDLSTPVAPKQPLAPVPAAPVLPPIRLPEIPVRVEIPAPAPPMIFERPIEEACITGDIVVPHPAPVIFPQPPKLPQPMPIFPEPVLVADPCEPSIEPVMKMAEYPYFIRGSPYIQMPVMGPGFIPAHSILVKENSIPRISGHHFKSMQNIALLPAPHMRRV